MPTQLPRLVLAVSLLTDSKENFEQKRLVALSSICLPRNSLRSRVHDPDAIEARGIRDISGAGPRRLRRYIAASREPLRIVEVLLILDAVTLSGDRAPSDRDLR